MGVIKRGQKDRGEQEMNQIGRYYRAADEIGLESQQYLRKVT